MIAEVGKAANRVTDIIDDVQQRRHERKMNLKVEKGQGTSTVEMSGLWIRHRYRIVAARRLHCKSKIGERRYRLLYRNPLTASEDASSRGVFVESSQRMENLSPGNDGMSLKGAAEVESSRHLDGLAACSTNRARDLPRFRIHFAPFADT